MNTLEELYYGVINAPNYSISDKQAYQNLSGLVVRHETELMNTLSPAQQETFQKFSDCMDELHNMTVLKAFNDGFVLATKIMTEVMTAE